MSAAINTTAADTAMAAAAPLLRVRDLGIAFAAGKPVVQGVSFDLQAGQKLALVGESGSGKTLTALALLGLLHGARASGQAWLGGAGSAAALDLLSLPEARLRALRGSDIAMIFQEPMTAFNPLMTVGAQIVEALRLQKTLAPERAWQQTMELLGKTGIAEPARCARAYPHQLSGGQRQRAMIAMALARQPRLLLADEPTTALDVSLRGQILDLLAALQQETGMAVLLITHDLNLVHRFADRVLVMEKGRLLEQGSVARIFSAPEHPYTQCLLASRPERDVAENVAATAAAPDTTPPSPPVLAAQALGVNYPARLPGLRGWFKKGRFAALRPTSFTLAPGRTLGVIGESGSGKSTLALAALGLLPFDGQLQVAGRAWRHQSAADRPLRRMVQVVFQDPFSSLSPRLTIEEIVGEGLRVHAPHVTAEQRASRVRQALADVGLTEAALPGLLARYPHECSGGQRQRIALARALIVDPALLVLDEPTSALDVTIQKQLLQLLQQLQKSRGLAYLLITHDVDVVRAMAHEVLVLKDGQVVESGPALQVLTAPEHPYTQRLLAAA
ncbi:MAG: dipeptide ABC transporter ATP-binding protein [Burkholderiaceae bacterium]|jgi:microcin C transport system ATP-binding protein|nr:dipeptide ABC transporter ATP-binding protein [Burkholderiaceae bacterium]